MGFFALFIGAGKTVGAAAPFMRVFIPLMFVIGVGVLGYYGYQGVAKRDTLLLARRRRGRVKGTWAVIVGAMYLAKAVLLTVVLTPMTIGLLLG